MKPVNYPLKPAAEEKKGHYHAPIKSHAKMKSLANHALEAPYHPHGWRATGCFTQHLTTSEGLGRK